MTRPRSLLAASLALLASAALAAPLPFADVTLPTKSYANNGGFERGLEGWAHFSEPLGGVVENERHSGQASLRVTGRSENYRYLNQASVPLVPGETYTLSAWIKCAGFERAGAEAQVLNLTNYGWTKSAQLSPLHPDEDWTYHSVTFEAPPTSEANGRPAYTLVVFWPINSAGTLWIDDIQIEAGPETTAFTEHFLGWAWRRCGRCRRTRSEPRRRAAVWPKGWRGWTWATGCGSGPRTRCRLPTTWRGAARVQHLAAGEAAALPDAAAKLSGEVATLDNLAFLSDPYRPLSEATLPDATAGRVRADLDLPAGREQGHRAHGREFGRDRRSASDRGRAGRRHPGGAAARRALGDRSQRATATGVAEAVGAVHRPSTAP